MANKVRKHHRTVLVTLIAICMGIILVSGVSYLSTLRQNLQNNAIQNVRTVTVQQRQAFDSFLSGDQERLHSFAEYFSQDDHSDTAAVQRQLTIFNEIDAIYSVICLDEGWFCSNVSTDIRQVDEENLAFYRSLTGSGVRNTFIGLFSRAPKFGLYETFTFKNGHRGLIQKSYDRTKISETFSLSFYDDKGFSFVVNQDGDILLRSTGMIGNRLYENIFDIVTDIYGHQTDIDHFKEALQTRETGSTIFTGERGAYLYTYVPVETVEDWYLVSIVPMEAITEETSHILHDSQVALGFLVLVLVICAIFILLIWHTHREIKDKEQEVDYQTQRFDVFSSYLANNTNDVYFMIDCDTHKMEYVTPNVERVLGTDEEHVLDIITSSDAAVDPDGYRAFSDEINDLQPGQWAKPRNARWVNPQTGEVTYYLETAYGTLLQGKPKRIVCISDRTNEQKIQDNLADALRMAQAANQAKSAFLSNVSHDIRTPMNAIIGFLALMRDEADNPGMVMEYTQRIDAASQHLLGLINDVLDMNKIESGSATLNLYEMNLAEIIDEINTIIRPQTTAKGQTFDIYVSHLEYEHLLGDKLRINQILINLLSNAVKYTPAEGAIKLQVEEMPRVVDNYSRIRFTVSDNGLGMSEDYLKVIFEPFSREENSATRKIQGTGLGMAITKSLVDLMGGSIHVESELGKGSTFTVELELRIQDKEDDPKFWEDYKVTKMIVADDEEEICQNIVKTMSQTGVITDYSIDGEGVLWRMRAARNAGHPYDLVLLDWKMPGLSGLETARLIRKEYSENIPILLLTAYDWSEIEDEAAEIGIDHFMPKPFFISTFKDAIRRVMGSTKKAEGGSTNVVQGMRILIVDDIEVNQIILVKLLGTQGATCDVAADGQEAVDKFLANEYDLILMDVQMPVMDGYTATRTIRASDHPRAKTVPIIAMTANAFVDDVRDAIESGMDAHIAKPVELEKLKSTIQQVLDGRTLAAASGE